MLVSREPQSGKQNTCQAHTHDREKGYCEPFHGERQSTQVAELADIWIAAHLLIDLQSAEGLAGSSIQRVVHSSDYRDHSKQGDARIALRVADISRPYEFPCRE